MRLLGRDSVAECYRIEVAGQIARLPDQVISASMRLTGGHGHQTAYDWIARHARAIETATQQIKNGERAKPPFDRLTLEPQRPSQMTQGKRHAN